MISIIVAISKNNVLGKENKLLWHLPKDFKFFKETTLGHPIIMGRKTFESLPGILSNRIHIVITRDVNYKPEDVIVSHSLEEAIREAQKYDSEIYICGGGQIYKEALEKRFVDKILLTEIDVDVEGDAFFPTFDTSDWEITKKECHTQDEKHDFEFCFVEYMRK